MSKNCLGRNFSEQKLSKRKFFGRNCPGDFFRGKSFRWGSSRGRGELSIYKFHQESLLFQIKLTEKLVNKTFVFYVAISSFGAILQCSL